MTIWLTSDTHFNHKKVITYSNRPFSSIEEMNESLIKRHNSLVKPKDRVYHLGDLGFFKEKKDIENIYTQLNGYKIIIFGNHDQKYRKELVYVADEFYDITEINHNGEHIILCHYPMHRWNKSHYGSLHCHGHVHGRLDAENKLIRRYDVGVDANDHNYYPVSLDEVVEKLKKIPKPDIGRRHDMDELE